MLESHEDDSCCGKRIGKALHDGLLESKAEWICPKCGLEWRPHVVGEIRHWMPYCPTYRW